RVGGIESRVIDERVPLSHGILGQETTGPGGFAMGLRSIPVLLDYVRLMAEVCPQAWLINFANPAGMMAEAVNRVLGWEKCVGICDAPTGMQRVSAAVIGLLNSTTVHPDEVHLDYFGLNHLGWIRSALYQGNDYLPQLIELIRDAGGMPGLPFDTDLIADLGMIPNEYLYYYYYRAQAVENMTKPGKCRAEDIAALNIDLFADLHRLKDEHNLDAMMARYYGYLNRRGETYMARETGRSHETGELAPVVAQALAGEGYAGVALDVIEALSGARPKAMILNVPNQGAIHGMEDDEVVEILTLVQRGRIQPLAVGEIPGHPLALMKQVKEYEQLTIAAALEGSYQKALLALTIHPLVLDRIKARQILDGYIEQHGSYFPKLS
ncbi:MAG: 6-phospho-beta-glucosidase, partial [Chloroflexota bacterium]